MFRLVMVVVASAACSFDSSAMIESDRIKPDANEPDFGVQFDASSSQMSDAALALAVDADSTDAAAPTCESIYGTALDYDLCEELADSCRFYVKTNEDTCTNLCEGFGGTCVDNYDGNCSTSIGSQGCDIVHFDQVCICSLPGA